MSFASLKKQSKLGYTDKLVKEVEKMNSTSSGGADDRFWKPEMDKTGVGSAIIRFLPSPDGEELPWAKIYSHAFKGPGGWYIENSLTTNNNGKDPVSEYNRELWNSGNDKDKETVRRQKRKLSYYSNIYVVKDPANPANEGKVFLYKFGKKIFDKILTAVKPEFDDETPVNVFDFWTGANFRLKIKKVDGYWNYDKSEFDAPSPLLDDDDALEALWNKQYSLAALVAPDQFKSYEILEKRLKTVLNANVSSRPLDDEVSEEDNSRGSFKPDFSARKEPVAASAPTKEEDDALSYFQRLAEDN
jgi:hypothetical protein